MSFYTFPVDLLSADLTLTADWQDVGSEIRVTSFRSMVNYVKYTPGDSQNLRFRFVALTDSGSSDEFPLPNKRISSGIVRMTENVWEFDDDTLTKLAWEVVIPSARYIKAQVKVGSVGATAGILNSFKYVLIRDAYNV